LNRGGRGAIIGLHATRHPTPPPVFEQAFRNIDDVLRKEAGCTTELDYTEQTSWLLFLKYLDALEKERASEAALHGKRHVPILDERYRWGSWAAPKKGTGAIEYRIGEIFAELKNRIRSGYNLREIIDQLDALRFGSQAEKHELSQLYEAKIRNMGNAGRNGGEYYTPRPLIRAIIQVVRPTIGERIYDGAVGSAGFLCEAYEHLKKAAQTTRDLEALQKRTLHGKEKKSLAYVIGIMNMILHGVEAPNIVHTNTLAENLADIQERDRVDVVLANPPFGGKARKEVQQNFPIRTGETAFLFLQHFIEDAEGGRPRGRGHQEHVPRQHGQRVGEPPPRAARERGAAHGARLPERHVPGRGREDGRALLHEGRAHAPHLALPARPGPELRQDEPAQRRGPRGVRRARAHVRRLAAVVERGRGDDRSRDAGPLGEESASRRGSGASFAGGDPRRDSRAGCGERGGAAGDQGDAVTSRWPHRRISEIADHALGKMLDLAAETRRLESLYQRKLAALDELKRSILHQAFTGAL